MRNKPLRFITILITVSIVIYLLANIYELSAKTYYIHESKLYRIDTFHLSARAYEHVDNIGKYSSKSVLDFKSTNGYSFSIAGNVFASVKDKKKLEDNLMYHDIKFTVFSNRENYDKYRNSKEPVFVEVYQIRIGNTDYIDISFLNKLLKDDRLLKVFCIPLCIFFFGVLLYKTDSENPWALRQATVFAITCFLIFLLIFIGVMICS